MGSEWNVLTRDPVKESHSLIVVSQEEVRTDDVSDKFFDQSILVMDDVCPLITWTGSGDGSNSLKGSSD